MGDRHQGRRHVIVGGVAGMGWATAALLAREAAQVAIVGRDAERAAEAALALSDEADAPVLGLGIGAGGVEEAIAAAVERLGGLDGLAVTAGPINSHGPFLELSDADWAESFETQLMTVVRSMRAAIPAMSPNGGAIVTVAAHSVRSQKAGLAHYAAMKSAVASVTKAVAKIHGEEGVRANCIAPGAVATEALQGARDEAAGLYGDASDASLYRLIESKWGLKAALRRVGRPEEIAELIGFLLSGEAAYLTGALINIDGGTDF